MAPLSSLAGRRFVDGRLRDLSFAFFFFVYALGQTAAYRSSYATIQERVNFAQSFGDNRALRLFYGVPHDLVTTGGYAAWRVGGTLAIATGAWGVLAAVKSMRAEEDAGREELVLSRAVGRRLSFSASVVAGAAGALVLFAAVWLGLVAAKESASESAVMAVGLAATAVVFVAIGALCSQLASTRRLALELGLGVLAIAFTLRVVADTSDSLAWLRWLTPLGWAEELRPFTGSRPAVLLLMAVSSAVLFAAASRVASGRDIGAGVLRSSDTRQPNLALLSSPLAEAVRDERGKLAIWLVAGALFAAVIGVLADSVSSVSVSQSLNEQLRKLGTGSITTASGYIAFCFLFFILIVCLFGASQIAAARHEEADGQLETLLAEPVGRRNWLAGRLLLAVTGSAALALAAGLFSWVGAASQGADVSLPELIGAGANALPITLLFLSLGALAFALVPRATVGLSYGLIVIAFAWQLFGSLLSLPAWTVDLTPFHHVALVPAQSFKAPEAALMLTIAALATVAALWGFRRRDLTGA